MAETVNIFGRNYLFISRADADYLENHRMACFSGRIDANTCELNCYSHIYQNNDKKFNENISGVIRRMSHIDVGTM